MLSTYYREKLRSLNVDRSSGHPKPHKVCLLLAVLDLIETNRTPKNEFYLDENLKIEFSKHFEHLKKANDAKKIATPFWHLQNDDIWHFEISSDQTSAFNELIAKKKAISEATLTDSIQFAYLTPELFQELQIAENREDARRLLLSNLEDLSVQFHRWLLTVGKKDKTARNYVGAVKGSISNWAAEVHATNRNLIAIHSYTEINRISDYLAEYSVFQDYDSRGKRMYSAALKAYQSFLADLCQVYVEDDIKKIISDRNISETEKARLVNTRVGQGQFREDLIQYWHGCAVTGYKQVNMLLASHIKPWRDASNEERLSHFNGILLLPNLDKAFDKGYISFEQNGQIQISDFIENPSSLGIRQTMAIKLDSAHQDFLAYHRKHVYKRT